MGGEAYAAQGKDSRFSETNEGNEELLTPATSEEQKSDPYAFFGSDWTDG